MFRIVNVKLARIVSRTPTVRIHRPIFAKIKSSLKKLFYIQIGNAYGTVYVEKLLTRLSTIRQYSIETESCERV
jgi:hypothetical protein